MASQHTHEECRKAKRQANRIKELEEQLVALSSQTSSLSVVDDKVFDDRRMNEDNAARVSKLCFISATVLWV